MIFRVSSCVMVFLAVASVAFASDRTTLLLPRAADAGKETSLDVPQGRYADEAMGRHADDGWKAYVRLWKTHSRHPDDSSIRRFLGLPLQDAFAWSAKRGRAAPRYLRWKAGSYAQVDTAHFTLFSRANESDSRRVAEDLEQCYWAWTQMFFPVWEGAALVRSSLSGMEPGQSITEYLQGVSSRITIRRKMRVVLFRDAEEYRLALASDYPGVERSTGFYASDKQTTFLYASPDDDAATRRHELVHQLFREATRSGLGRSFPGEQSGFWLIEGIAGYFESLAKGDGFATVGGWDCARLQFARYRNLVLGDVMPIQEVVADGRVAAQQRSDITRWYAHAIAHTHRLLDGHGDDERAWVYAQLAKQYRVASAPRYEVDTDTALKDAELRLREFLVLDDQHIRTNPVAGPIEKLVLAECNISPDTIAAIEPQTQMNWLDLTRIRITTDGVTRLVPDPKSLEQLRLEATAIDASISKWLGATRSLAELDLSWTPVDDAIGTAIQRNPALDVLYLTGSKVSDAIIDVIIGMPKLQTVDLQRTAVTDGGLQRLRRARPQLDVNPLRLVESQN